MCFFGFKNSAVICCTLMLLSIGCESDDSTSTMDVGPMAGISVGGADEGGAAPIGGAEGGSIAEDMDYTSLKINEINTKGDPSDWVEIYNTSTTEITLAGCGLSDDPGLPLKGVIPSDTTALIPANGFALFLVNNDTFGFKIGSEETITLSTPTGDIIDQVSFVDGDAPQGTSYGRLPDGSDTLQTLYAPTPASANTLGEVAQCGDGVCDISEENSCPEDCIICGDGICDDDEVCTEDCAVCGDGTCDSGEECSIDCVDAECGDGICSVGETCDADCITEIPVVINEVVAAGSPDWVELYNLGTDDIDLSGLFISDDMMEPFKASLDDLDIVSSGFLLIEISSEGIGFGLKKDEALYLFTDSGSLIDFVDWEDGDSPEGQSYGRVPDGTGNFQTLSMPTPSSSNE